MNEFYIILTGVLLRIAIPALVLLGLAVLLSRLDARWKRESARQDKELKVVSNNDPLPCWEIRGCSAEEMETCPAKNSDEPCWQVFRQENGDFDPICLNCEVFLNAAGPVPPAASIY